MKSKTFLFFYGNNKETYVSNLNFFLIALLCVFSLNPFYIWGWDRIAQAVNLILIIGCVLLKRKSFSLNSLKWGFLSGFLTFVFYYLGGASIFGSLYLFLFSFTLMQFEIFEIVESFNKFKQLFTLILIPGLLLWFLHHFSRDFTLLSMGYVNSDLVPTQLKVDSGQSYALYPFTVVLDYMLHYTFYRLHGPFDEPGLVGTISALILMADGYKLKSYSNYVLILSGLLSFSLAFYMLTFLWIFLFYLKKPIVIITLFLIISSIFYIYPENEFTLKIVYRLAISDGKLSGDNRTTEEFDQRFNFWKNSSTKEMLFGFNSTDDTGSSSWKRIPIQTGIVGSSFFILILGSFAFRFSKRLTRAGLIFLMLFFLSIYQRPFVIIPAFIVILVAGMAINLNTNLIKTSGKQKNRIRGAGIFLNDKKICKSREV